MKKDSFSAYWQFLRAKSAAMQKRNGDPIRVVRSHAFLEARKKPGCTDVDAIAAANAAEIALRLEMGITEALDTSKPASDFPCFPSDIRSIDHWHSNE